MKTPFSFHHRIIPAVPVIAAVLALQPFAANAAADRVQLLVKPKAAVNEHALNAVLASNGAAESGAVEALGVRVISVPTQAAPKLLDALQRHNDVEYAEPDFTAEALGTANDPLFTQGSEWHLSKIQAPAAWDLTTGSASVVIAVVDTGVRASHPDLAGKVLTGGYDYVAGDNDPTDENGHGTAVAGTVSPASDNALGVAGVTWANPILPVRVLDANGSGSYSSIANGITYSADHGAKIINLSLGGTSSSRTLQSAVDYAWKKQCVIIAAAGNNGNNIAFYPAACNNVVSVSATDSADAHPGWSNYGSYVDVSAPGLDICTLYGADQYAWWSGTSFSCPVTSGVVALMASANDRLTNVQLVDLLIKNSDDIGAAGYDVYFGNGRVNAFRAVSAALALVSTDTSAPVVTINSPLNGSRVSTPSQKINVSATDNVGVTKLELYIDGKLFGTSTSSSATFSWSTSKISSGTHSLLALGYDAAGNVGTSAAVSVWK